MGILGVMRMILITLSGTVRPVEHSHHDHPYGTGRLTAPRKTIASCVNTMSGAFTVEQLAARVRDCDSAAGATATVYRAVGTMEEGGYLERVGERDGSALFARCGHADHHHHIICEECGKTASADCPLDSAFLTSIEKGGFRVTRHEVTLYGKCPSCASLPSDVA